MFLDKKHIAWFKKQTKGRICCCLKLCCKKKNKSNNCKRKDDEKSDTKTCDTDFVQKKVLTFEFKYLKLWNKF